MNLKKCPSCKDYNLTQECKKCSAKTEEAHYKFSQLRDEEEIHPEFKRTRR
jgi:rRNA maturation protein Nop10